MIEIFDFIVPEASHSRLDAGSMEEAIGLLVDGLTSAGHIPPASAADVTSAFIRREQLGSTAIGGGYAVPQSNIRPLPSSSAPSATRPRGSTSAPSTASWSTW